MTTTKITPKVSAVYEVGAILHDSWGCEQTQADFYCIVKRAGPWLTILPMKKQASAMDDNMCTTAMPGEIDYTAKPVRKMVKVWDGVEKGFTLRNYSMGGWCNLWSGKAARQSHYA